MESEESETEEFEVERILDHKFDEQSKEYRFLVKWANFDSDGDNTWERESNLVANASEVLADYKLANWKGRGWHRIPNPTIVEQNNNKTKRSKPVKTTPVSRVTVDNSSTSSKRVQKVRKLFDPKSSFLDLSDSDLHKPFDVVGKFISTSMKQKR